MRIHSLVVIDMASGETLADISYEYMGPLSLCGGGGSESTTNTVDYAYNARMATLSEEQQEWAREYFNVWKEYQKPYEIAQAQANMDVLPQESGLYKNQLEAGGELLPADKQLMQEEFGQASGLIPPETLLMEGQLTQATRVLPMEMAYYEKQLAVADEEIPAAAELFGMTLEHAREIMPHEAELYIRQMQAVGDALPRQSGVYDEYLDNASGMSKRETALYKEQLANLGELLDEEKEFYRLGLESAKRLLPEQVESGERFLGAVKKGIDVNERMALAKADAAGAWKDARGTALRANARLGVSPNSGRFQGVLAALETQEAEQLAGAVTQARVGGEQENFARMAQGAAYNGAGANLQPTLPARPQPGNFTAANAALQAGQAVKPQTGSYTTALGALQASQSVKQQPSQPNSFANEALKNVRTIISHAPRGGSSEILQGVSALKGG